MATEADGILTWALEGLRRLMNNNYIFSETTRTADELKRYKLESNSALMFLDECCDVTANAECVREILFEKYREYCSKNGFKAMSQINFNKELEASGNDIERSLEKVSRRKIWKGVRYVD